LKSVYFPCYSFLPSILSLLLSSSLALRLTSYCCIHI
jgi:hypothetical protein